MNKKRLIALAISGLLSTEYAVAELTLEEVVVSARKRAESLEDSPISVKAFTDAEIQSAGIQTTQDFVNLTPNVTLVQTQNAGNAFLNIRGVSQARNSEMSAAILIDGVLMTNPAQLNQQLFDIEQIEVLRGPQGALYGRNAIGGAITIVTKAPSDETEGTVEVGTNNANGVKVRGSISTPLSENVKLRLAGSYLDHDGFLDNTYLNTKADPVTDTSLRMKLLWDVNDHMSADFRLSYSDLDTTALYFVIDAEADDTDLDIRTNNRGNNQREFLSSSLKLEWTSDAGSVIAITAYDDLTESLSGDQFSFTPRGESYFNFDPFGDYIKFLTGDDLTDLSQNQYLEVESISQEIRFVSPEEKDFRYILGAYAIATDRYISTGNQIDRGLGVFDVKKTFRPSVFVDPTDISPQLNILADGQDNFAWAIFGQMAKDLNSNTELAFSLRYDRDTRENTTLTPALYNTSGLNLQEGESREETWSELQPKLTLRYQPDEQTTMYADLSRGFRSGGFNQTGVGEAVPAPGVGDIFEAQVADTFELGYKSSFLDRKMIASVALYHTNFDNAYFFYFDPGTSTQNLGNINKVTYQGMEIEATALLSDTLSANIGIGLTNSDIKEAADPTQIGNEAPLVSDHTVNVSLNYRKPVGGAMSGGEVFARMDYQRTGETWWDPNNLSSRSPINVVDLRAGYEKEDWSISLWMKNATDEKYNTEFSPGPAPGYNFLWKALPRQYGVDFMKRF